jgi:nitrite reductase/ring-hydroxylating ferredoxin subunit
VLTSFGVFVGNLWISVRSMFSKTPTYPQQTVARFGEIQSGSKAVHTYPTKGDHCILVWTSETEHVSYSQKCTHLSCAVYYSQENNRPECPRHKGFFSIADGRFFGALHRGRWLESVLKSPLRL